jgi:hypothetical protein
MDMRGISEIEARKPPPVATMAPAIELSDGPVPIVLNGDEEQNLGGFDAVDSDDALNSDDGMGSNTYGKEASKPEDTYPNISSGVSLSTATQTHEVRQPMYLPTLCGTIAIWYHRCQARKSKMVQVTLTYPSHSSGRPVTKLEACCW